MNKYSLISLLIIVSFVFSCSKDASDLSLKQTMTGFATIIDGADVAVDGCGWLIEINDRIYHPVNLSDRFKIDQLKVFVQYKELNDIFICNRAGIEYPTMEIIEMFRDGGSCDPVSVIFTQNYTYAKDDCSIFDVEIKDDCLEMKVVYSGGCKFHDFNLLNFDGESPLAFYLSHDANGDACEALITSKISFDLEAFRYPDSNSTGFFLCGQGYKKYFVYNY